MGTAEHLHLKNDEKEANIMMNIVTVNAPLLSIFFVKTYRKNCFIFIHADKNIFRMQRVECLTKVLMSTLFVRYVNASEAHNVTIECLSEKNVMLPNACCSCAFASPFSGIDY